MDPKHPPKHLPRSVHTPPHSRSVARTAVAHTRKQRVLVGIEGREQRVLEGRVLGRLLEVAVHLASSREDALNTTRVTRQLTASYLAS